MFGAVSNRRGYNGIQVISEIGCCDFCAIGPLVSECVALKSGLSSKSVCSLQGLRLFLTVDCGSDVNITSFMQVGGPHCLASGQGFAYHRIIPAV